MPHLNEKFALSSTGCITRKMNQTCIHLVCEAHFCASPFSYTSPAEKVAAWGCSRMAPRFQAQRTLPGGVTQCIIFISCYTAIIRLYTLHIQYLAMRHFTGCGFTCMCFCRISIYVLPGLFPWLEKRVNLPQHTCTLYDLLILICNLASEITVYTCRSW